MSTPQIVQATPPEITVPLPTAIPLSSATPPPDPLVWLMGHRSQWPREITLKADTLFPIIYNGTQVGSGTVRAGNLLALKGITPTTRTVLAAYPEYSSEREIGIDTTNLLELASIALRVPPKPTPGQMAAVARPPAPGLAADPPFRSASRSSRRLHAGQRFPCS